jgi:hypothetical protein
MAAVALCRLPVPKPHGSVRSRPASGPEKRRGNVTTGPPSPLPGPTNATANAAGNPSRPRPGARIVNRVRMTANARGSGHSPGTTHAVPVRWPSGRGARPSPACHPALSTAAPPWGSPWPSGTGYRRHVMGFPSLRRACPRGHARPPWTWALASWARRGLRSAKRPLGPERGRTMTRSCALLAPRLVRDGCWTSLPPAAR